ncbi:GTPase [Nymphaea thermarum]|nr:GTPase [Nymphaea thermarum]
MRGKRKTRGEKEEYAKEIDEHKETVLLVNKADLLPLTVRKIWARYFRVHGIQHIFWSAKAAAAAFEGKKLNSHWGAEEEELLTDLSHEDVKVYGRDELLVRLHREGKAIVEARENSPSNSLEQISHHQHHYPACGARPSDKKVVVGFVGYPNVGKSSTINALVGEKRTGVTSTPGKTKHFQTLIISEELMLCDCPGLVFPSFTSSRHDMVALGVLPIDRMTEHRQALQVVANHVPRVVLENVYNISLPKPKPYESQCRPPFSSELLRTYCSSRGYVSSSGLPDETRAARQILKDYIDGKLPHFQLPPELPADVSEQDIAERMGLCHLGDYLNKRLESDSEKQHEASEDAVSSNVANLLSDLDAFDSSSDLAGSVAYVKEKKAVTAKHKHHKKPQRKKDRSWRVRNDGGDGMPVVGVFQKPVSFGAMGAI